VVCLHFTMLFLSLLCCKRDENKLHTVMCYNTYILTVYFIQRETALVDLLRW